MLRSILSVVAGFVAMAALVMAATIVSARLMLGVRGREQMMKAKPTPAYLTVNLIYSAAFAGFGGFLTATLAGFAPLAHALALAGLLLLLGIASVFKRGRSGQPEWYSFVLLGLGPVCASLGGYGQLWRHGG
jgi:hypothetical protein